MTRRTAGRVVWFLAGAALATAGAQASGGLQALSRAGLYGAALGEPVTVVCTDAQGQPVAGRPPPETRISIRYVGQAPGVAVTVTCR